jgi:hypothetical protein
MEASKYLLFMAFYPIYWGIENIELPYLVDILIDRVGHIRVKNPTHSKVEHISPVWEFYNANYSNSLLGGVFS